LSKPEARCAHSRSALSMLVGALFKKSGLFLNTPQICYDESGGGEYVIPLNVS
jgi:hypothetical protein